MKTKILFIGESWKGSSARSLKEGLSLLPNIYIEEVSEDHYIPKGHSIAIRAANKFFKFFYKIELSNEIKQKIRIDNPSIFLAYKGNLINSSTVQIIKAQGIFTVNVFPDCSPHAHGRQLRKAIGEYDLVISTKPFHPENWKSIYGYSNKCVFVPHGYDPTVHYWPDPPEKKDIDIILLASWRPLYEKLLLDLSLELDTSGMNVLIAGNGWGKCKNRLPSNWHFPGGIYGRLYGETARRAKIVLAPVHSKNSSFLEQHPGDVDTTRTYELASAGCFFLHQRTDYVKKIYNEETEVPMWSNISELSNLIKYYLPLKEKRDIMAIRAHKKAVPNYSTHFSAQQVMNQIRSHL
jgi:hypothetical protein